MENLVHGWRHIRRLLVLSINQSVVPSQVASIILAHIKSVTKVIEPVTCQILDLVVFKAWRLENGKIVNARSRPELGLPSNFPGLEPRATRP